MDKFKWTKDTKSDVRWVELYKGYSCFITQNKRPTKSEGKFSRWQAYILLDNQLINSFTGQSITGTKASCLSAAKKIWEENLGLGKNVEGTNYCVKHDNFFSVECICCKQEKQKSCKHRWEDIGEGGDLLRECSKCYLQKEGLDAPTQDTLDFDEDDVCLKCQEEECSCATLDADVTETITTKTYKRKEKKLKKDTIRGKELSCALWFIDKMDSLDRAEKVFSAAMAAARALETKDEQ